MMGFAIWAKVLCEYCLKWVSLTHIRLYNCQTSWKSYLSVICAFDWILLLRMTFNAIFGFSLKIKLVLKKFFLEKFLLFPKIFHTKFQLIPTWFAQVLNFFSLARLAEIVAGKLHFTEGPRIYQNIRSVENSRFLNL